MAVTDAVTPQQLNVTLHGTTATKQAFGWSRVSRCVESIKTEPGKDEQWILRQNGRVP